MKKSYCRSLIGSLSIVFLLFVSADNVFGKKPEVNTYSASSVYRTKSGGNWNTLSVWEVKIGEGVYEVANSIPQKSDDTIYINHEVIINSDLSIDQIIVNPAGHLIVTNCGTYPWGGLNIEKVVQQPEILVLGALTITNESVIRGKNGRVEVKGNLTIEKWCWVEVDVIFNGNEPQILKGSNHFAGEFEDEAKINKLIISNPQGVTIENGQNVKGLVLDKGILKGGENLYVIGACQGGSASAYVERAINIVNFEMNNDWYFPLGVNNKFLPVSITTSGTSDPAYSPWQAIRITIKDGPPPSKPLPSNISNVSSVRHYLIETFGTVWAVDYYLRLSYNEEDGVSDPSNLTILKFNGVQYRDLLANASGMPTGSIYGSNSFKNADYYCVLANKAGGNNLLPVTWLSFDARAINADAHLNWVTAQSQNCLSYEVERSTDGLRFFLIGNQVCRNTSVQQSFSFVDVNPGKGTFYYRLKQVDNDAKYNYSSVRKVSFGEDAAVKVFPNPVRGLIQLVNVPGNSDIRIYDETGRLVLQSRNAQPVVQLQVGHLPSGIYELIITTVTGERLIQKVQMLR